MRGLQQLWRSLKRVKLRHLVPLPGALHVLSWNGEHPLCRHTWGSKHQAGWHPARTKLQPASHFYLVPFSSSSANLCAIYMTKVWWRAKFQLRAQHSLRMLADGVSQISLLGLGVGMKPRSTPLSDMQHQRYDRSFWFSVAGDSRLPTSACASADRVMLGMGVVEMSEIQSLSEAPCISETGCCT